MNAPLPEETCAVQHSCLLWQANLRGRLRRVNALANVRHGHLYALRAAQVAVRHTVDAAHGVILHRADAKFGVLLRLAQRAAARVLARRYDGWRRLGRRRSFGPGVDALALREDIGAGREEIAQRAEGALLSLIHI